MIQPKQNLPQFVTPFIGRVDELAETTEMLANPACNLLSLVGPGGIGKTRLAAEIAKRSRDSFAQGVYFVPLQSVETADALIAAIADVLQFPLSGQEEVDTQLLNYLRDKKMLLLLDSFEHLLGSAQVTERGRAGLLSDILMTAPGVKFLVATRAVLHLQEEWIYALQGLPYPCSRDAADLEHYGAVQLFIERARRMRRDFSPAKEEVDIVRICQLVEGMPLGLELAASWTKTTSCQVIADEIQGNIDFLATSFHNVPDHQRSMRAMFDQSWKLLTEDERRVFKQLSVFRNGFQRQAAEQIAGASLSTLSALIDKSLLQWNPHGRYQVHELLRQYAAQKLVLEPEDVTRIYDLHSAYYARYLHRRAEDIISVKQSEILQEIAAELENIRAAWQWAVNQANVDNIQLAVYTYYHFCDFQGRFKEAADAFDEAIKRLESIEPDEKTNLALALLHALQGWNYIRLGRFAKAITTFKRSQKLFQHLDTAPPPGFGTDPLPGLALVTYVRGDYAQAITFGQEARQQNEARQDKSNLLIAFYVLGSATLAQGDYQAAETYFQQAHTLTQETNNQWMRANILSELGNLALGLGHYDQAQHHYQASFSLKEALNDPEGMARALTQQGNVAWLQKTYPEAETLYRRSVAIYQNLNDRGGLARALRGVGNTARAQGNKSIAYQYFYQALQIAAEIQFIPFILSLLINIGELMLVENQVDLGLTLIALVAHHPASEHKTRAEARQVMQDCQATLKPELFAAATQRGQSANLETMITTVQVELAGYKDIDIPIAAPETAETPPSASQPLASSVLVEPLTPRELEVLHLMAQGMTNKQIAAELIISVGTAKWYTSEIYGKLGVTNRTQAVARARDINLLSK